uniref:NAD(P)-dependent oxidoreductase n=1 Tax=Dictyoglomus thermophilum TaxID=14 RepID=A0A7C3RW71_DICTH
MKVLITGATGFIGSHLVENLIKNNIHEIFILKRSTSDIWRIKEYISKIRAFDIDKEDIMEIVKDIKPDVVIHLATYYRKYHNYSDLPFMLESNIGFPTKILESMASIGVRYFINTGTFFEKVYSYGFQNISYPFNLYASTKLAFEEILKFYAFNYGIKAITLRIFSPYGYRDNPNKLIPYLIKKVINDEEIDMTEGFQSLDFIYVKDIVEAYIKAMNYIINMKGIYQSFDIGTGITHTLRELICLLEKISGKKIKVNWGKIPYSNNEVFYSKADISSTINFLKWIPKYDLEKGLEETFECYSMGR